MKVARDTIRVLVVEHDKMIHAVIAQLLEESVYWKFEATVVESNEAVEQLSGLDDYNVVLVNLELPGHEPLDNLRQLKQLITKQPIVAHTANNDDAFIVSVWQAGADDCLWRDHILRGPLLSRAIHYTINQWNLHEQLRRMAIYDELTGVMSRRFFLDKVTEALSLSQRYQDPFVLCICDLDSFKDVNDTWGHLAGDRAIIAFVEAVKGAVRQTDFIGRIGGDEFCILLQRTTAEEVSSVVQRLIDSNIEFDLGDDRGTSTIGASFGLVQYHSSYVCVKEMIHDADEALYQVKRSGRGQVAIAPTPIISS